MNLNHKVCKEGTWYFIFEGNQKVTTKAGNPLRCLNNAITTCASDELDYPEDMYECASSNMVTYLEHFADVYATKGWDALREKLRQQWSKPDLVSYPRIEHSTMLMTKAINHLRDSIPTLIDEMDECQLIAVDVMLAQYPVDLIKRIISDYLPINEAGELEMEFLDRYCSIIGKVVVEQKVITDDEWDDWVEDLQQSIDMFCFYFNHGGHPHQDDKRIVANANVSPWGVTSLQ